MSRCAVALVLLLACGGADGSSDAGPRLVDAPAGGPADAPGADGPGGDGATSCPAGRATADRPDDSGEAQIHVVYMIASDGADRALDTDGTLATSVSAWNNWLAGQTGGPRLRIDRCGGAIDITFVRSSMTEAAIAQTGAFVRDTLESELDGLGFTAPNKLYAVYYDGESSFACGGGAWPPTLVGTVAAMYLDGLPDSAFPCRNNPWAADADSPGYLEFAMLHEILHTLGAVASCAPNHHRSGHSSDDPTDLMYAGDQTWRPSVLDVGGDDYWNHSDPGCLDLADSAFVDPTPASPTMPPSWPRP